MINGKNQSFEVGFENERYVFKNKESHDTFEVKRDEDEWHTDNDLPDEIKTLAVEKLEQYLLSQH